MPVVTDFDQSDDWKDREIRYLRGEVEKLRAELAAARKADPMRNLELRERGLANWVEWL